MSATATAEDLVLKKAKDLRARLRQVLASFPELPPVAMVHATTEVLEQEIQSRSASSFQNATAQALLRGVVEKEELKSSEGGHVSADVARTFLGLSKPALLDRFTKGRVLGWREKNAVRFPVWQFAKEGGLLPGLEDILLLLKEKSDFDDWAKILFFLNPRHSLGGKRPLDLLREGRTSKVIELAQADE